MDHVFKLVFLFLFLFSSVSYADTYPSVYINHHDNFSSATYATVSEACTATNGYPSAAATYVSGVDNYCDAFWNGSPWPNGGFPTYPSSSCPGGGTLNYPNCINAPPCGTGQVRNSTTGICGMNCTPPETDNGFGQCAVKECTGGQVLNACTGACQTPVTCSSTFETYDSCTNSCVLDKLNCPTHSHANSTNDACLPDPPLACLAGQHDDGSYNCVADDAEGCSANERRGYINGKLQCIPKTDAPKAAGEAADAKKAADDAAAAAKSAQDAADAAKAARDADPTNQAKIDAYNAAQAAANAAALAAIEAASKLADANAKNQTAQLTAIQENTEDSAGFLKTISDFFTDSYTPINEPSQTVPAPVTIITTPVTVGGAGTCPADIAFSTSVGSYTLSIQPLCSLASSIAPLFIAICFLISGFIVFGAVKG